MTVELIAADLPNIPEEVVEIWLLPHYNRFKVWPPTLDSEWRFVLGRGRDLKYLRSTSWRRELVDLSPSLFSPLGWRAIHGLFVTHILHRVTEYSVMTDSFDRFQSCVQYLRENGVFPKPVILNDTASGFEVWDGNHRLTAFFYLYGWFKINDPTVPCLNVEQSQAVWICES